ERNHIVFDCGEVVWGGRHIGESSQFSIVCRSRVRCQRKAVTERPAEGSQHAKHATGDRADWLIFNPPRTCSVRTALEPQLKRKLNQSRIIHRIVDDSERSPGIDILFAAASCAS